MPQALWVPGFGAINGKLYVAGGSDGVTQLNTLYIYDIASNTWTTGANVPVAAEAPGSAVLHNQLYLFGGVPAADHDANLQSREQYLEPLGRT